VLDRHQPLPADGRDSATLMKNADVAMYYAKEKGRNNYQFFSAEMNARAQERLSVENYLRLALRAASWCCTTSRA
jgi:predicted signal transduction protein with EAL and GGDEF domain